MQVQVKPNNLVMLQLSLEMPILLVKFEEIDRKHTILIQGLQQQFQQHEQRFIILEKASRPVLQPQPPVLGMCSFRILS